VREINGVTELVVDLAVHSRERRLLAWQLPDQLTRIAEGLSQTESGAVPGSVDHKLVGQDSIVALEVVAVWLELDANKVRYGGRSNSVNKLKIVNVDFGAVTNGYS
jgi:hypothetical protein